jgi:hypothetical protein
MQCDLVLENDVCTVVPQFHMSSRQRIQFTYFILLTLWKLEYLIEDSAQFEVLNLFGTWSIAQ